MIHLSYGIDVSTDDFVSLQSTYLTDGQTDGWTDRKATAIAQSDTS